MGIELRGQIILLEARYKNKDLTINKFPCTANLLFSFINYRCNIFDFHGSLSSSSTERVDFLSSSFFNCSLNFLKIFIIINCLITEIYVLLEIANFFFPEDCKCVQRMPTSYFKITKPGFQNHKI